MHHAKKLVVALTSLLILTGCTTGNQQAANHTSVKTKTVRVEKRTAANKAAWAKARAASRANAASAKALSSNTTQLAIATSQAKRQSEQLKAKHDDAIASSKSASQAAAKSAASEAAAQSRSQSEAQSASAVAAASQSKQAVKQLLKVNKLKLVPQPRVGRIIFLAIPIPPKLDVSWVTAIPKFITLKRGKTTGWPVNMPFTLVRKTQRGPLVSVSHFDRRITSWH